MHCAEGEAMSEMAGVILSLAAVAAPLALAWFLLFRSLGKDRPRTKKRKRAA